jgi:hypothetical protein
MRHCVIVLHRGIQIANDQFAPKQTTASMRVSTLPTLCGDRRQPLQSPQCKFIKPLPLASNSQEVHRQFFAV